MSALLEKLKQSYPCRDVPPHGNCLVIPDKKFSLSWEPELRKEGLSVLHMFLPGGPAAIVKLKNTDPAGDEKTRVVYKPERGWTEAEDEQLIRLWNTGKLSLIGIAKSFPRHSFKALEGHVRYLQKNGKIKPRFTWKHHKKTEGKSSKEEPSPEPAPETVADDSATPKGSLPTRALEENQTQSLLKEIRDLLQPPMFIFEYHCRSCRESGCAEDSQVWKFCPRCGQEMIVWNIQEV
jgi:hypothetical protein